MLLSILDVMFVCAVLWRCCSEQPFGNRSIKDGTELRNCQDEPADVFETAHFVSEKSVRHVLPGATVESTGEIVEVDGHSMVCIRSRNPE